MKKLFIVVIILSCLSGAISCRKNLLKTVPTDRISTDIFWNTSDDATFAANAIYNNIDGEDILHWDGFSDIAHINVNGGNDARIDQGNADALSGRFESYWTSEYNGIYKANYFLDNIDKVKTSNTTLIDNLKGQVTTLRAYYYLNLVSWFGAVPLVTKPATIEEAQQVKRDNVADIYDFIESELNVAATLLPLKQPDNGRITRGAALALQARAMLYAGRYQKAADAAQAVMDLNVYSLYPAYKNLFSYSAENNNEVIMDKEFASDIYSNSVFHNFAPASQHTSVPVTVPTKVGADMYEMTNGRDITDPASGFDPYYPYENRDPRMRYSMFVLGDTLPSGQIYNPKPGSGTPDEVGGRNINATRTGYNIKKYINAEDLSAPGNCGINLITIRYAEVLLTYTEAKIELGQIDQSVYDAINEVRQRPDVNMPVITAPQSQQEMRSIVRRERTVELAFEGLHTLDIRRWHTAAAVMQGPVEGMTYVKNGQLMMVVDNSFVRSFDPNKDYLWPIPQQEVILNKNLNQNPGW